MANALEGFKHRGEGVPLIGVAFHGYQHAQRALVVNDSQCSAGEQSVWREIDVLRHSVPCQFFRVCWPQKQPLRPMLVVSAALVAVTVQV